MHEVIQVVLAGAATTLRCFCGALVREALVIPVIRSEGKSDILCNPNDKVRCLRGVQRRIRRDKTYAFAVVVENSTEILGTSQDVEVRVLAVMSYVKRVCM